jgi:putative ABC transport system permease protein
MWVASRFLIRRKRAEKELNEEIQFHLERDVKERLKAGIAPRAARREALLAMGAIEMNKEACRDVRGHAARRFLSVVGQDLRFALRLFRRHPAPISIALGGLALAIGVVTAVFSIVNASMLRPYGMDDPASVAHVARSGEPAWVGWPYAQFLEMRAGTTLAAVEASVDEKVRVRGARDGDDVPNRSIRFVSGGYLEILGGRPFLGRALQPADDLPAALPVVVVSHTFWRTYLNADASLVGKSVWVNDTPVTLVGVLQPEFTGPVSAPVSMWAALAVFDDLQLGTPFTPTAAPTSVEVIARLAPGTGEKALQENLSAVVTHSTVDVARPIPRAFAPAAQVYSAASPMSGPVGGDTLPILISVIGIVVLVLALACANTANLLMACAVARMREMGLRLAMGATRGRLVRQLISESVLLGVIAGAMGFVLAFWLVPLLGRLAEVGPEVNLAPDWRVLVFTLGVALVSGVGAGLSPARYGSRGQLLTALQSQSGGRGGARMPPRFRQYFVALQAAVSMLLLVCAALLVRAAVTIMSTDVGFDADRLIAVSLNVPRTGFDEPSYVNTAIEAVRQLASVQAASVTLYAPWGNTTEHARFNVGGRTYKISVNRSDAHFLRVAGLQVLRGSSFTPAQVAAEAPVALISESVARAFFPGIDPIGQALPAIPDLIDTHQNGVTIIGVVRDAMLTYVDTRAYGTIYRPLREQRDNAPSLVIRTAMPAVTTRAVEGVLRQLDPRVRVDTRPVREGLDRFISVKRRLAAVLTPVAVLALVLAGLGVYGVTTFVIGQRTEEVSVRLAIGASPRDVMRLLLTDSLRPVIAGLVVGMFLALIAGQVFARELGGVSPRDPLAIGASLIALLSCAVMAVILPARRAARTDPSALLRRT